MGVLNHPFWGTPIWKHPYMIIISIVNLRVNHVEQFLGAKTGGIDSQDFLETWKGHFSVKKQRLPTKQPTLDVPLEVRING